MREDELTRRRRLALWCSITPGAFGLGSLALRLLLAYAPTRLDGDLAQPVPVVTAWGVFGALAWIVLAFAVLAGAFGVVRLLHELQAHGPAQIRYDAALLAASLLLALAAAYSWPAIFSSDVYAYAAYGDLAVHGANAYAHQPLTLNDSIAQAAVVQWGNPPPVCVYGPAFVALMAAIVAVAHENVTTTLALTRIAACAGFALSVFLLWFVLDAFPTPRRLRAVAAYALNPVALWCVAEGHNDALMLCFVFAGIALARRGRAAVGTFVMALGGLLKAPGVAAAVFMAFLGSSLGMREKAAQRWLGCALGSLTVALVGLPLERGVRATIGVHGRYTPQFSLQAVGASLAGTPGIFVVLLACAAVGYAGVRAARSGERDGLALLATAVWLAIPNPYPWYALWILPIAVVCDGPVAWALAGGTIAAVVRYFPDAVGTLDPNLRLVIALLALSPFALLLRRTALKRLLALALFGALAACAPQQRPTASPSPTPPVSATATPTTAATAPATTSGTSVPTVPPSPTVAPYSYIYTPAPAATSASPDPTAPQILEIDMNARVLDAPGPIRVRILTSSSVTSVTARTMGHELGVPQQAPGIFGADDEIPNIPSWLRNRTYGVEFIAASADGRTTSVTLPITLR